MIARIDADVVAYKGITVCEGYFAQMRACTNIIDSILDYLQPDEFELVLSGPGNFRKLLDPTYKAGRPPKPPTLHDIRNYFIKYYPTVVTRGEEADDYLAATQTEDSVIVSNDKDMLTIPGHHLRLNKSWERVYVTQEEAEFNFFLQCLIGDEIDNVPGLLNPEKSHWAKPPNFTKKTATEVLEGKDKVGMFETVKDLYHQVHGEDWFSKLDLTARLLWLKRSPTSEYYDLIRL
jgi:hypothetical protein